METPSPSPSTPAPAPSAPPPSAPASTPTPSSSPSTPTKYGQIPKSKAQEIWDQIDGAATARTPGEEGTPAPALSAEEIPIAEPPTGEPPAPTEPVVDPQASPNEAGLPPQLRESLKAITDPKVRAYLADSAHMRATLQKTGLPFAQLNQFIAEAPEYLQKAPTLDILNQISATADEASAISTDFMSGTDEGFRNFNETLLKAGPLPYVQNLGFLLNNLDGLAGVIRQHYGDQLAGQIVRYRDGLIDRGVSNLVGRMRAEQKAAEEAGKDSVLGEVADELEKYVGLKERTAARNTPRQPDPRDLRIQALETEKKRAVAAQREQFTQSVFNQAGNTIQNEVATYIGQKGSGFTKEAQAELVEAVGNRIYDELLHNKGMLNRVAAINASGKWDQAHNEQLTNLYVTVARRLLGGIATPALRKMGQLTGAGIVARQQKVAAQVARKDPGASGSSPRPRVELPKSNNPQDIFDHLDKLAEARAGGG